MHDHDPRYGRRLVFGGGGLSRGGKPPTDLIVLLAVLFVTFTLQFFEATAVVPAALRLTPLVWTSGFLWQLLTYPFIGEGAPGIFFVIELLILFWFARDVYSAMGRKRFWKMTLLATVTAGVVAILIQMLLQQETGVGYAAFPLLQGQRILIVVTIAAFATLNGNATIYLFFVLPVQARWFILLEIVFAFLGFLSTKDLAGFLGICSAVGVSWSYLTPGGPRRGFKEWRLRRKKVKIQRELRKLREERGIRVVKDEDDGGPWIN